MGVVTCGIKALVDDSPDQLEVRRCLHSISAVLAIESWPLVALIYPRYARKAIFRELNPKNVRSEL